LNRREPTGHDPNTFVRGPADIDQNVDFLTTDQIGRFFFAETARIEPMVNMGRNRSVNASSRIARVKQKISNCWWS